MPEEQRQGYIDLDRKMDEHIDEFKAFRSEIRVDWGRLVDLLEGQEVVHFDGTKSREGGMIQDVKEIKETQKRRGLTGKQVTIIAATIAALGAIVAALITTV